MKSFLMTGMAIGMVAGAIMLFSILGTLFGAIGGWIVGLFFSNTITGVLASAGITGVKVWELGAFLGFMSGFFRSTVATNKD